MHLREDGGEGEGGGPSPEELEAEVRRSRPPENEVPVVVPVTAVLGRTPTRRWR